MVRTPNDINGRPIDLLEPPGQRGGILERAAGGHAEICGGRHLLNCDDVL